MTNETDQEAVRFSVSFLLSSSWNVRARNMDMFYHFNYEKHIVPTSVTFILAYPSLIHAATKYRSDISLKTKKMKLLTWMHRKFRQGNGDTLKEFPLGQTFLDDPNFYQKQNQGKQGRLSFMSAEAPKFAEHGRNASLADEFPEYFEGFLAIGTLGIAEAAIPEAETPTFAVSFEKLAEGEAEVTVNELRLINDELERVLASEAKDDGWTDSSGRNSHVSNGRISHASTITLSGKTLEIPESTVVTGNNLYCPLQEYLLGSAVEMPEKVAAPKKENRTSLGELFEKHKAEETLETKCKRGEKREDREGDKTASMNLMKKILMKKKNALHAASKNSSTTHRGNAESASAETKLCKILQKFHKKVHPESLASTEKSDKIHKNGFKNMLPCTAGYYKDEHAFPDESATFSLKAGHNGYTLCRKSISNPTQYTKDGSDSDGSRGCWIKTDADYLVLEL